MTFRPLGIAREVVEEIGLEVVYAYDDLVFVEHNAFHLQFDDRQQNNLKVFFNRECEPETATHLELKLTIAAQARKFTIENAGRFELVGRDGSNEFDVRYLS